MEIGVQEIPNFDSPFKEMKNNHSNSYIITFFRVPSKNSEIHGSNLRNH